MCEGVKNSGRFILLFLLFLFNTTCDDKPKQDGAEINEHPVKIEKADLLVYGSMNCSHCIAFLDHLKSKEVPHTFYDVDKSDSRWQEMYSKVKAINYKGYVSFPIIDARGKIFVNPKVEEVLESLK